ncbi:outer membrane protein assembly factor BamC [Paraglaciecola aquimarina]|uniref:Outer membrane protein assembly factor BamC n=1 Tax=Paraglaciecola aquimarina TaxID=1235557 RepID=A0ABU3SY89_9ALTE|nr:outer membrane protein assembly factor BamC [Paraglaciecola aquimarina]MDU0354969.1 outer membrane protein assembly factor BamC [Paraglaciecola aquimarina]
MTHKIHFISLVTLGLLTACSSLEEREMASGSFDYLQENPGQRIDIPEDVDTPNFSDAYKLPEIGEQAQKGTMGEALSIASPALVLPIVTGSHIEEGSKDATIWFDQVDDSQALDITIWNSLIAFLEKEGIGVKEFNKERQFLETDWLIIDEASNAKWYSWSKSARVTGQRFKFDLELKPHGRTAALKAQLLEYKQQDSPDSPEITQSTEERRHAVDILNEVVKHYEFEIKLADVKRIREIRQGLAMALGFDEDGEAAYVVDAKYDIAWPRFLLVLRKLGFDVKDYDKSTGLLFTKFNGVDDGWWSGMWGDDNTELNLTEEEYRFKLGDLGPKTSVTLLDSDSKPFPVNKLTDLYDAFSKVMSAENLDI